MSRPEQHYRKVRSHLDGIEADGGTITTGGPGDGWVVLPTVWRNTPSTARVWVNCFFVRDLRAPFGGVGDGCRAVPAGALASPVTGRCPAQPRRCHIVAVGPGWWGELAREA